ncbi:hypothetical protein BJY54_005380 [Streptomyces nodosus]|nr:hypothetical protein [Streptomyces nodosus]
MMDKPHCLASVGHRLPLDFNNSLRLTSDKNGMNLVYAATGSVSR